MHTVGQLLRRRVKYGGTGMRLQANDFMYNGWAMDAMANEHVMGKETQILGQNGPGHSDTKLVSRN